MVDHGPVHLSYPISDMKRAHTEANFLMMRMGERGQILWVQEGGEERQRKLVQQ